MDKVINQSVINQGRFMGDYYLPWLVKRRVMQILDCITKSKKYSELKAIELSISLTQIAYLL